MPPVSAAEKSMTAQTFHLREPMMGWLATHVCLSCVHFVCKDVYARLLADMCTSFSGGIIDTAVKYSYPSANPH